MKREYEIRLNRDVPEELQKLFRLYFWDEELEDRVENKIIEIVDYLRGKGYSSEALRFEVIVEFDRWFWERIEEYDIQELMKDKEYYSEYNVYLGVYTLNVWGEFLVKRGGMHLVSFEYGNLRNTAIYEFIVQYREWKNSQQ